MVISYLVLVITFWLKLSLACFLFNPNTFELLWQIPFSLNRNHHPWCHNFRSWPKHESRPPREPRCQLSQVQQLQLCYCTCWWDPICRDSRWQPNPHHIRSWSNRHQQCMWGYEMCCCHNIWSTTCDWTVRFLNWCSSGCLVTGHWRRRLDWCPFWGLWIYWKAFSNMVQNCRSTPDEHWGFTVWPTLPFWIWTHN